MEEARDLIEYNKKAYIAADFSNATGNTTKPKEISPYWDAIKTRQYPLFQYSIWVSGSRQHTLEGRYSRYIWPGFDAIP